MPRIARQLAFRNSKTGIGSCVIRVNRDRLLVGRDSPAKVIDVGAIEELAAQQVLRVCRGICRAASWTQLLVLGQQFQVQGSYHGRSDLILDLEYVVKLPIEDL